LPLEFSLEKRFVFALFLSAAVLLVWTAMQPPPLPVEDPGGVAGGSGASAGTGAAFSDGPGSGPGAEPEPVAPALQVDTEERETAALVWGAEGSGHWRATFSNRGARLLTLELLGYHPPGDEGATSELLRSVTTTSGERTGSLVLRSEASSADLSPEPLDEVLWVLENDPEVDGEVRYVYGAPSGVYFRKIVRPIADSWDLEVVLEIENRGLLPGRNSMYFRFEPAACVPWELADRFYREPNALAIGGDDLGDLDLDEAARNLDGGNLFGTLDVGAPLRVIGVHNKYFACLLRAAADDPAAQASLAGSRFRRLQSAELALVQPEEAYDDVVAEAMLMLALPMPGSSQSWTYRLYCGPKDPDELIAASQYHARLVESDLGFFSSIGKVLSWTMTLFHGWTGNWGVAIILLTLCVRLLIFPLTRKSQVSMARFQTKMKRVQPKIDEVKARYENDPKRLREEQAKIMQEEKAFPPLGGCLPIFIQMPIFFGLFSMLRSSFDLRQAGFVSWIDDLSQPDRLLELGIQLPLLGDYLRYLNLLPPLMVLLWILQQRGMPQPTDEQARRMQRMMMWMPVFMGVFLYNYAAGLSLYMITQSTLGIFEQRVIKKLWPIDETEVETKSGCGCGPFSGIMENLAEKQKEQMKLMQERQRLQQSKGGKQQRQKKKR